jgi:hypothetical protein
MYRGPTPREHLERVTEPGSNIGQPSEQRSTVCARSEPFLATSELSLERLVAGARECVKAFSLPRKSAASRSRRTSHRRSLHASSTKGPKALNAFALASVCILFLHALLISIDERLCLLGCKQAKLTISLPSSHTIEVTEVSENPSGHTAQESECGRRMIECEI